METENKSVEVNQDASDTAKKLGAAIERMIDNSQAQKYRDHPGHAYANLRKLQGQVESALKNANDDPLLFAYDLRTLLAEMAGTLITCQRWVNEVLDADSPDLVSFGANLDRPLQRRMVDHNG